MTEGSGFFYLLINRLLTNIQKPQTIANILL